LKGALICEERMLHSLEGKVALVTGAWGINSIGSVTAAYLGAQGADVAVSDLPHPADRVAPEAIKVGWNGITSVRDQIKAAGRRSVAIECDLSDERQIEDLVAATARELGGIDILVNASRAFHRGAGLNVMRVVESDWDWVMAVNVRGPLTTSKHVGRLMAEAGKGGSIINISSIASVRPTPLNAAYSTSKAALNMLTRVMALDLAPHNIRVNAICPGVISTSRVMPEEIEAAAAAGVSYEQYRNEQLSAMAKAIPLGRVGTPEEVAKVAYFLASDLSSFITGQCLTVDGGSVI
jgi:3-oxoacyl-[acyl-carrier protein] reductase